MKNKLRNITVTLEVELAKWARIEAARQELSVSRFLAFLIRKERKENDEYAASMKRDRKGKPFLRSDGKYQSREDRLNRIHSTRKKKRMTVEEMLALGKHVRSKIKGPLIDHAEFLYDEYGLPK